MFLQVAALILATSLVQLANGYFTTFVSLKLHFESFSPSLEGLILSSYFIGFTFGSVITRRIIQRVGHIRAYAAFGGIVIASSMAMGIFVNEFTWMAFRALVGFGCVGLFVTTESWLNAKAPPAMRGRVLSVYMVGSFLALGLGQLLVGRLALGSGVPLQVIAALFAIALVVVSMTRAAPPQIQTEAQLPFRELWRKVPLALFGVGVAGMVSACVYAVAPAWMLAHNISQERIGLVMLSVVVGGLALQIPIGWLSDRMDRRVLIAVLALLLSMVAMAFSVSSKALAVVIVQGALLGGLMSTIYPVCVSLTLDRISDKHVVSVSSWLILASGVGSVIGPFLGNWLMVYLDLNGVLYLIAATTLALGGAAGACYLRGSRQPRTKRPFSMTVPHTMPPTPYNGVATRK